MIKRIRMFASASLLVALVAIPGAQQTSAPPPGGLAAANRPVGLVPTAHPAIPMDPSQFWLMPDRTLRQLSDVAVGNGIQLEGTGEYTKAIEILSQPANRQGL